MRHYPFICIGFLLFLSCNEENPSPESFLSYDLPYYVNINSDKLYELNEEIKQGTFGDIHSLLILRGNKIVFENYYSGYQNSDLHPIGATTQSVISALVGVALTEDSLLSTRTKIIDFLPGYSQYFENIPQKDQIEIRHLMSNTSGLWWDEWNHPFGSEDNDAFAMTLSADWISAVLATPMIREPGYEFNFNSGNGIIMAPLLNNLTGIELEEYAKEKLFEPLSISEWEWEKIPGDYVNASWGLHLKPVDMAKIGYLFLKKGVWNEHTIFNENWAARCSRSRTSVSNYFNYGYFWWRFTYNADAVRDLTQNDVYFSWGDGGQFIFVIPQLDMVIVSTAGNYSNNDTLTIGMFRDYIIPAVADRFR